MTPTVRTVRKAILRRLAEDTAVDGVQHTTSATRTQRQDRDHRQIAADQDVADSDCAGRRTPPREPHGLSIPASRLRRIERLTRRQLRQQVLHPHPAPDLAVMLPVVG
jgi:hypothetical protein